MTTNPCEPIEGSIQSTTSTQGPYTTNVHVQVPLIKKNGMGTAGFTLALIGLFLSWVPVLGWIVWLLGAILSIVGDFKTPRGLAIAGTVISFIDLILLLLMGSAVAGLIAFS